MVLSFCLRRLQIKMPSLRTTDDWLVGLLSTLWHSRDRQSAETGDIVESNANPEEADIVSRLFSSILYASRPPE